MNSFKKNKVVDFFVRKIMIFTSKFSKNSKFNFFQSPTLNHKKKSSNTDEIFLVF